MAIKPSTNRKRGEYALNLSGEWIVLVADFDNIARYEESANKGIYTLADQLRRSDLRQSDIVRMIWAFYPERNEEGFTLNEINSKLTMTELPKVLPQIAEFLGVIFATDVDASSIVVEDEAPATSTSSRAKKK